jgi:hypothetical protein
MQQDKDENIMKAFPKGDVIAKSKTRMVLASFIVVVFGLGVGYLLSRITSKSNSATSGGEQSANVTVTQNEAGVGDDSSFPDTAQGILVEGGIKGEGTYHLERPGGESQNVYLTSTVINLQSFVGKKVEVRGQTLSAVNAGWLMDVGKIKVIN